MNVLTVKEQAIVRHVWRTAISARTAELQAIARFVKGRVIPMSDDKMRAEFEAAVMRVSEERGISNPLRQFEDGSYLLTWVDGAWIVWQAACDSQNASGDTQNDSRCVGDTKQAGEPVAWLRYRNVLIAPDDAIEGFEVCEPNEHGDDGSPAFPVYDHAQPQPDWTPCSERLPTEADADPWGNVIYIADTASKLLSRPLMVSYKDVGTCALKRSPRSVWKPTGLTRPQPPEDAT